MKKDSERLRIGILGCGPVSQIAHFDACNKARNVDLYAICDAAEDLLSRMTLVHRPEKSFRDFDEMLADERVDAVIIAVADQFHVQLCQRAAAAGKHVFVEKPLGVSVEECLELQEFVHRKKIVLQVGNNRRFDPGVSFARRFIQEELGGIMAFKGWYCDSTFRYTMTDNLQPVPMTSSLAKRPEGNPKADRKRYFMLTHGSHLVDTARFLAGEISAVQARYLARFDAHTWFVDVEFASGALGHLDLTIPVRGDFEEGFRIYGENGSINGRLYLPWFHKAGEVECFSAKDKTFRKPIGEDAFTYKLQLESFAHTILDGAAQTGANIDDGVAAVRVLAAISRSAVEGNRVKISESSGPV